MGKPVENLTNRRFGKLLVIRRDFSPYKGTSTHARWLCKCDCGNETIVISASLKCGDTTSCGCHQHTLAITHGMKYSPEWRAWKSMRQRCSNKNNRGYHRYGGRGIFVCNQWKKFETFYKDMGPRPTPKHSVDRVNNDGPYSPDNCRWALPKQQSNNMENNRRHFFKGKMRTTREIYDSEKPSVSFTTFHVRINQHKWSISRAISTPLLPGGRGKRRRRH